MRTVGVVVTADPGPFKRGMIEVLATAQATEAKLNSIRDVRVNVRVDSDRTGIRQVQADLDGTSNSINNLTGRLAFAGDMLATLGPAAIPIGATLIPTIAGLATGLTVATGAGLATVLALQGVGDALGAIEAARLDPTVENLQAAEEALGQLTPAARDFARQLGSMRQEIAAATVGAAGEGLFPGLERSLDSIDTLLPRAESLFRGLGDAVGDLTADSAESLASPRWEDFFDFIESEARPVLTDLYGTVGNVTHGLSELLETTGPLSRDFTGFLRDSAGDFDAWAEGLSKTEGYRDFVAYLRENGPQVAETASAIGSALVDITQAAAPLGGPALAGVEAIATVLSTITDSPIGTPLLQAVATMALLNRTAAITRGIFGGDGLFGTTRRNIVDLNSGLGGTSDGLSRIGRTAGGVAAAATAVAVLGSALAEATGAKVDTANLGRDIEALANGATPELLDQVGNSLAYMAGWQNKAAEPIREIATGFGLLGDTSMDNAVANIEAVDQTLAQLVESGNAGEAERAFQRIAESVTGLPEGASIAPWAREDILGNFGAYKTALDNAASANDEYASSTDGAGDAASGASVYVNQLARAMRAQTDAALGAFDAQTAWGQAVADAQRQARGGAEGLDVYTKAGRANRESLSSLAAAWNAQGNAVTNNIDRYRDARRTFLDVADAMDIPRQRAQQLADRLLKMPKSVAVRMRAEGFQDGLRNARDIGGALGDLDRRTARPRVDVNDRPAGLSIRALERGLSSLDRTTATPRITANNRNGMTSIRATEARLDQLDRDNADPNITANDQATPTINRVTSGLNGIRDKSVTITINEVVNRSRQAAGGGVPLAMGGMFTNGVQTFAAGSFNPAVPVAAYANGGYGGMDIANNHLPEFAGPGPTRIWREEETLGESYIPHANDYRRPRAKSILEQTAGLFGGEVRWFADGGLSGSLSGGGGGGGRLPSGLFGEWLRERREAAREAKRERRALLAMIERTTPGDQSKKELKRLADKFDEFRTEQREQAQARKQSIRDFAPEAGGEESDLLRSLREFERSLTKAGGTFTEQMRRQGERLVDVNAKFRNLVEQLDGENGARRALEDLTQAASDFRTSVGQSINNTIFGNGLAGLELQLSADANDNASMEAALRAAVGNGLDAESDFFKALAASGDLNTAQQLGALDAAGIDRYEALYAGRTANQSSLSMFAGQAAFSGPLAAQAAAVASLQASIDQLGAQFRDLKAQVRDGVMEGAERGTRVGAEYGTYAGAAGARRQMNTYTTVMVKSGARR